MKNLGSSLNWKALILTGWNVQRVVFIILGVSIIGQAISNYEWLGILFGLYFLLMGIFRFGCAGGNCNIPK